MKEDNLSVLDNDKVESQSEEWGALRAYFNSIKGIPLLTQEEEKELGRRIRKGDRAALEKLVASNLRFVIHEALKYRNLGVPLPDLINEGNLGLIHAAKKFDPDKNVKFTSYAVWWIKQAILKTISEQNSLIRLPIRMKMRQIKVKSVKAKYRQEHKTIPTLEELEEATELSKTMLQHSENAKLRVQSLDESVNEDGDTEMIDLLKVDKESVEDRLVLESVIKCLKELIITTLTERERCIIIMRYGLDGKGKRTLQEVGEKFNITRERVRQIEESVKAKLRKRLSKIIESKEVLTWHNSRKQSNKC